MPGPNLNSWKRSSVVGKEARFPPEGGGRLSVVKVPGWLERNQQDAWLFFSGSAYTSVISLTDVKVFRRRALKEPR